MKLPEVGEGGQKLLEGSTILAVGAGGLGCASLPWLVRSGIGRIVVVDPGTVDKPDLGRQVLYREVHLGQKKAVVAAAETCGDESGSGGSSSPNVSGFYKHFRPRCIC